MIYSRELRDYRDKWLAHWEKQPLRIAFGEFVLDNERRELRRGAAPIAVEPQVFDVLVHLVRNRDRVVSKDDLIASVWLGRIVSDSTLTSRINAARAAIGDNGQRQSLIKTYARKGFRFIGDVTADLQAADGIAAPSSDRSAGASATAATLGLVQQDPAEKGSAAIEKWGGRPTVAVLPFRNLGSDPDQEYFSDGVTEDIITALSKYRSLAVIARNSTFAFKGSSEDAGRVGQSLGAAYLIGGSVRRAGQRLRVSVQLVETRSGQQVWADRYDRTLADLFCLQDEITTTIAARIEPEVSAAERQQVERKARPLLHAWDLFRLGTMHFYKSSAADNAEAQGLFRRAIALDPGFSQAYGYLSYALVLGMLYFDSEPNAARLDEATAIGRKAVELDDQDGLVRFMYGRALLAQGEYADALAELETAVALNPCLAMSYCGLGDTLTYEGRIKEALPYFQRAVELSPHDPLRWAFYSYRALAHLFARDYELANDWAHKATRVPNAHFWAFAHRVSVLGHLRGEEQLPRAVAELLHRRPDFTCTLARKRLFYIKRQDQIALYLDGLRKAGIPA